MQPEDSTGNPGRVNLTSSKEGIRLNLSPLGAIAGKVTDQDGQPLRAVNVLARSVRIMGGMRQTNTDDTAITDDRGIFRVWNLLPGKYYVEAAGRNGGANLYAGDSPPQYHADQAFLPGYFGGGSFPSVTISP
jgi:hypothetical protein